MKLDEMIVNEKGIGIVKRERSQAFIYKSIKSELIEEYEESGWILDKKLKHKVRMKKDKPIDIRFENEVWLTFANLGFSKMNKDRQFKITYSSDSNLTQQIDVFAADEETIILIECKCSDEIKKGNFKESIDAIGGRKEGIIKELKRNFKDRKYKIKFIFATKNYIISPIDLERMKKYDIAHFDEDAILYYTELGKHLGHSARFQLLGNLFEGQKIPEIDNIIPAIEGCMGGFKYYSFSIEPEKLLKIGYVLHRNKANKAMMPTYQRLIKKQRLIEIQNYVNDGGFFPNSIIINVITGGSNLRFDLSSLQSEESLSRIGLLHLPQKYKSAFIIDGQHRLYGYAESKYKSKNTVPVVAFIDLSRSEQIKLFMDINENQKAVPKNLRNTLSAGLLWDSPNYNEQRKALRSQIAQDLGEDKSSPLFEKIIVGENQKTPTCCITLETIQSTLGICNFFSMFKANEIIKDGTFDKGNNDATYELFFPFLLQCFEYIRSSLPEEWGKGENDNGFLAINAGILSLIKIFNDIIDHLVVNGKILPKIQKSDYIIKEMGYYLDPMIWYLKSLSQEQKDELRKSYGVAGRTKYWRTLQKAISDSRLDFNPSGLIEYWIEDEKVYNEESYKMIRDIEGYFREDFKNKLQRKYGDNWFMLGLPKPVYDACTKLAADKNYEGITSGKSYEPWECLMLINYREIATYGSNWSELFEKEYTKPGEERISGGKQAKTEWITQLSRIRNQIAHSYSVTEEEYGLLKELYDWLVAEKENKRIS